MVSFSIPQRDSDNTDFINFNVTEGSVLFAGSRHISIPKIVCSDLIKALGKLGFSFVVGCANGVDQSFRSALQDSDYADTSIVACAFKDRAVKYRGIYPLYVVPSGLSPRVALAKRTLWMTSRCSMLILFPSDPIGRGSKLAFKSTIMNNKPVFVVSNTRPIPSDLYSVYASNLFGIVDGWWCVPPVYETTGLCYEQA